MANEITKTIWGGLISSTPTVDGTTTMRQQAANRIASGAATQASSTDISRAASVGSSLTTAIPSTDALGSLSSNVASANLVSTLNTFLALYSQIRVFSFHETRTSWGNGNGMAVTADYTRVAYKSTPAVSIPSDSAPGTTFNDIELNDVVDLSNYKAIINTLNGIITTNSAKTDVTVNYCHSSCHSVCHSARGRR